MSTTPDATSTRRGFPLAKLVLGVLAGLALALAFGAGALLAYQGQYEDRIYPGVTVDGVDVAGLTKGAAVARLQEQLAGYGAGSAVVSVDGKPYRVHYAALGRRADVDSLVDLAWSVGRDRDGVLERTVQGLHSYIDGTPIGPLVVVDPAAVRREVAALARRVDAEPVNGSATTTDSGFEAQTAVFGTALPQAEVAEALVAGLADPAAPDTLALSYETTPVEPEINDEEVAATIEAATRMATDLSLTAGKESWKIPAATVRGWIGFEAAPEGYRTTVDEAALAKALKKLAKKVDTPARDASFRVAGGSKFSVVAARNGRAVDLEKTAPLVARAVADRGAAGAAAPPVALAMTVVKPRFTTEEAKKAAPRMRKISSWTTYYEVSERNGFANNISIPARDLDGVVVPPGGVFDFWQSIGPVTAARGYRSGGAIINGRSQPTGAFAGGICSTSTTLFNAVARAGYQMQKRANHYYYISRYPTGLDATVAISGGAVTTMSWKNDSEYPVMIRSSARPGVVSFSLYTVAVNNRPAVGGGSRVPGSTNLTYKVANGRTVTFRTSSKRNYNRATSSSVRTSSLPAGRARVVEYPVDGFSVTVTRQVREHGELIRSNTWISNYARVNGLTLVGTR